MSIRLMYHRGSAKVLPPRALLEPHVERTSNHWFWLLEFYDDGLDRTAVFSWAPPAEATGVYVVARLLWCWENDGVGIKRLQLENTCGLATCINPAHWRYQRAIVAKPMMLPAGADAHLVQYLKVDSFGQPRTESVHIVRNDSTYAVCGVATQRLRSTAGPAITCKTCVTEWQSSGAALCEVP